MNKLLRIHFIPFLVLVVIFFDELFHALILAVGVSESSGVKQYGAILLALIVYAILFKDLFGGKINKRAWRVLVYCSAILFLYLFSSIIYGLGQDKYVTYLLCLGSESIPAAYIGALFAKSGNWKALDNMLPYFIIFTTLLMGVVVVNNAVLGVMLKATNEDSGGLNYQTVSYYMAFAFTYCCYYVFYAKIPKSLINKCLKVSCSVLLFLSVLACLASGGRGALVVIFVITIFVLFNYIKSSKAGIFKAILIIAFLIPFAFFLVMYFDIMETNGMGRIMDNMTDSSTRDGLYKTAFDAFLSSPIWGNGLGSVFSFLGIYSHNFILDFLVEAGLAGAIIMLLMLYNNFRKLNTLSKYEPACIFFVLVFISTLINHSFSNYWAASMKLFLICSFTYCSSIKRVRMNT